MKRVYFYSGYCTMKGSFSKIRHFSGVIEADGIDAYRMASKAFRYIEQYQAAQCNANPADVHVQIEQFNRV